MTPRRGSYPYFQGTRKCSQGFDARIPRLLVYSFAQRIAFQIGICLHPSVGLYDLLGNVDAARTCATSESG